MEETRGPWVNRTRQGLRHAAGRQLILQLGKLRRDDARLLIINQRKAQRERLTQIMNVLWQVELSRRPRVPRIAKRSLARRGEARIPRPLSESFINTSPPPLTSPLTRFVRAMGETQRESRRFSNSGSLRRHRRCRHRAPLERRALPGRIPPGTFTKKRSRSRS